MRIAILLTATINPNTDPGLLSDPEIRKLQYLNSLNWYLKNTNYSIIFCENSGEDLTTLVKKKYLPRVEFLKYIDYPDTPDRGKGYKELKILEYVYLYSKVFKQSTLIVKITGRLVCLNIQKIINYYNKFNCDFVSCTVNMKNSYTDSRMFIFTQNFLPVLLLKKKETNYSFGFEDALLSAINIYIDNDYGKFIYFPIAPKLYGVCGRNNIEYPVNYFSFTLVHVKHIIKRYIYKIQYSKK